MEENKETQPDKPDNTGEFFTKIKDLINSEGFKPILDFLKTSSSEKLNVQLKFSQDQLGYFKYRYWQDIVMVGIIIGAIIVLTFCDYIEKATTGTLLGTIIGYALGRLKTRPRAFNK